MSYFNNTFSSTLAGVVPASGGGTTNFLRADGTWAAAGGGSGTAISTQITQASHGFSVGQVLYFNGTSYALLQANSLIPHLPIGMVSSIVDANNFILTMAGMVTGLSGLTSGAEYYVSDSVAGALTSTPPSGLSSSTIVVFIAMSTTSGIYIGMPDFAPVDNPNFQGDVTIVGTGTPISLSGWKFNAFDTVNSYIQNNIQNQSTGTLASSDWIATADSGTDSTNYVDFGINNSGYSVGTWTINGALDGYFYAQSGNLAIGTATAGKNLVLFTGGTLAANARLTISDINITPNVPISIPASQGITLASGAPTPTTNALYNVGGLLYFNGSVLASSAPSIFVQNVPPPSPPSSYLWIQTGLGSGHDMTFWIEDGLG